MFIRINATWSALMDRNNDDKRDIREKKTCHALPKYNQSSWHPGCRQRHG